MQDGTLRVFRLGADADGHRCPGCGAHHPRIDGVDVVLRDADAWLAAEGATVLARADLPAPLRERVIGAMGGPLARDLHLERSYGAEEPSPLRTLLRELIPTLPGPVLELGCGSGLASRPDATGVDLNFSLLRRYPGRRVLADAADPPFLAQSFGSVTLVNLLDSCRDPALVLAQAEALLAPGGLILTVCAFAWNDTITPRDAWLDSEGLRRAADGEPGVIPYPLQLRIEAVYDPVVWRLRAGTRAVHEHACQVLVARKAGG